MDDGRVVTPDRPLVVTLAELRFDRVVGNGRAPLEEQVASRPAFVIVLVHGYDRM